MKKPEPIRKLESKYLKKDIPVFRVGDTVRVQTRIIEGDKERLQMFVGTVIGRNGTGLSETISLHRVAYGEGMERVFPIHSPKINKIELVKAGKARRSKLYYLRGTSGKAAKVKGHWGAKRAGMEEQVEETGEESAVAERELQAAEATPEAEISGSGATT